MIKRLILLITITFSVIFFLTLYFLVSKREIRESPIRLGLKNSGCEKARSIKMLKSPEKTDSAGCVTDIFTYTGYVDDDPFVITRDGRTIEIRQDEILLIETNSK